MFCQKCGAQNDDNSKFCLGCGNSLTESVTPVTSPPPPPPMPPVYNAAPPAYQQAPAPKAKKSHAGVIIIVLLLVLAVIAAGIWFFMFRDNDDDKETTAAQTTVEQTTATAETTWQETSADATGQDTTSAEGEQTTIFDFNDYFSGTWPDSPLLNGVPKPDFGKIATTSSEETTVTVSLSDVTAENYVAYVEAVKNAGFDKDISTANVFGAQTFAANNGAGLEISVVNSIALTGWIIITVDLL